VTDASTHPLLGEVAAEPDPDPGSFRDRLLDGLRASIEERGYQETTITDIVRHARASRRTFYLVFPTKDDCFVALMQSANRRLLHCIAGAVDLTAPWQTQARDAVEAYFDHIAAEPGLSLSWVREFPALGDVAQRVQRDSVNAVATLIQRLSDNEEFRRAGLAPISRELALVILGGLRELTATTIEEGRDVREVTEVGVTAILAVLAAGPAPTPGPGRPVPAAPRTRSPKRS
jgi:AcrR family transcriptional regulator